MVALASNISTDAVGREREVDAAVVEPENAADSLQRRHRAGAQHGRHIFEETAFFLAMAGIAGHVGAEIMYLPVRGYRQVQRVRHAVDEHHAVFAGHAVRAARIQILDGQQFLCGQSGDGRRQGVAAVDPDEMPSGMEAGPAQQYREGQIAVGEYRGRGQRADCRCDHALERGQPARVFGAPREAHPRRRIDHRRGAARDDFLGARQSGVAKIGVPHGVYDERVRRQWQGGIMEFGIDRGNRKLPIADPQLRRNIAAARRDQHEQRHAHPRCRGRAC